MENSFPSGDNTKVEEWGGTLASNPKTGELRLVNIHTDHNQGSVGRKETVPSGFQFIGSVHTHPYTADQGAKYNATFSDSDIENMRDNAGTKNFTS